MSRDRSLLLVGTVVLSLLSLSNCRWFAGPPELRLQTMASGGTTASVRAVLPPNTDESTSIVTFAAARFEVYVSEISSGMVGERIHLFRQVQTEFGPQPVFFSDSAAPLAGLNVDVLPSSVGIIYVQASAFLVFNGNEWFGTIYGSDAAMIDSVRGLDGRTDFALDDMNFYIDPTTLEPVEFVEYHVAFIDAEEIGLAGTSYLLHYQKTSGHGDNDPSNDVWDFGSLSEDSPSRAAVVQFLSDSPYGFAGAESSSTDNVYILVVPMQRIGLLPGDSVLVTISVERDHLVGLIHTGASIAEPAAVRYTLDPNRAPVSFGIMIE